MATYANMDTLRFQLYNVHQLDKVLALPHFADYDLESVELMLDAIKDFSDQELYPVLREMDEQPAHYADGKIIVHPSLERIIPKAGELGLFNGAFSYEDGGMQLPYMLGSAIYFIMDAANNSVGGYFGLTAGAAELIAEFGKQSLKDKYMPKMLSGEWGGTMCLTEPQAGSSLSDITTTAIPQADGTFKIKGQKIFISGGDHEYAKNFVHLVLARIEGAPAGTKGISLFVVPKQEIAEDGSFSDNDVATVGDFQKLGQKGYCTTHLAFGENDNCYGHLVGEEHRGLNYMFLMMNGARISVGRGAAAIASAAYHASLQYANERPQGRRLNNTGQKDATKQQSLIIEHADVRRMLLLQKSIYEGCLSLTLQSAHYSDMAKHGNEEERERYHWLLELLTPITKTYPSEKGKEAVDNGVQVLGGYGFTSDFVLQQYYRDIRIFALYEGTTGIQSLDLLGRKVTMGNGKAMQYLAEEVGKDIEAAVKYAELRPYAAKLGDYMKQSQKVMGFLLQFAQKGEYERFLADATIFMEYFGTLVVAWQWLKMGTAAKEQVVSGNKNFSEDFYESTIHTMRFFFTYELSKIDGLTAILTNEEALTMMMEKEVIL